MEPVLITRGTGFIGSHTCKGFTAAGFLSVTTRRRISSRLPSTLRPEMAHFGTDYHSQQRSRGSRGWPSRAGSLDVEPQHVVLGQTQSADGGAGFEATMRAVPVIAMQPDWEFGGTLIGIQIRAGIRPLA